MRRTLLASAVLLGLTMAPYPQSSAGAACAAPTLEVPGSASVPVELRRGDEVTVTGRHFTDGCDDTDDGSSFGCSSNDSETRTPMVDVELVLLRGQPTMKHISLAVADAGSAEDDQLGWITWTFTVPEDHPSGRAVLKTEGSEPLRVRVVR